MKRGEAVRRTRDLLDLRISQAQDVFDAETRSIPGLDRLGIGSPIVRSTLLLKCLEDARSALDRGDLKLAIAVLDQEIADSVGPAKVSYVQMREALRRSLLQSQIKRPWIQVLADWLGR